MAERKKRSRFRELSNQYADEAAKLLAGYGALQLPYYYSDFVGDTKKKYLKNITALSKKRVRRVIGETQLNFPGMKEDIINISTKRLIDKKQANYLRGIVHRRFSKKPKKASFRFFRDAYRDIKALNPSIKEAPKELRRLNIKSLRISMLRNVRRGALPLALTFLSVPLAKAYQARYAPKRKFKKELKRGFKRGVVNPIYGGVVGVPLSEALDRNPYLRRSSSIRSLEGRLAQKYGQGVSFYKGSSGFTGEDKYKLEKGLAEYRKIKQYKRKRKR